MFLCLLRIILSSSIHSEDFLNVQKRVLSDQERVEKADDRLSQPSSHEM
jgi:hypothetical protein